MKFLPGSGFGGYQGKILSPKAARIPGMFGKHSQGGIVGMILKDHEGVQVFLGIREIPKIPSGIREILRITGKDFPKDFQLGTGMCLVGIGMVCIPIQFFGEELMKFPNPQPLCLLSQEKHLHSSW